MFLTALRSSCFHIHRCFLSCLPHSVSWVWLEASVCFACCCIPSMENRAWRTVGVNVYRWMCGEDEEQGGGEWRVVWGHAKKWVRPSLGGSGREWIHESGVEGETRAGLWPPLHRGREWAPVRHRVSKDSCVLEAQGRRCT